MKTLFQFTADNIHYELKGNNFGKEQLWRNGQLISERRVFFNNKSEHRFLCPKHGPVRLRFVISLKTAEVSYWLETPDEVLHHDTVMPQLPAWLAPKTAETTAPTEVATENPVTIASEPASTMRRWFNPLLVVGILMLKLSKSAGAIKAALAGTALAGWAWLFNLEFAFCLIFALFIHEYGHILAMKQSGLKVKGIYLLPFIGGVAVSERSASRWQDFKIAIAGPALGTLGAAIAYIGWLQTGNETLALFAAISLLLNLFNLLPMVPLDGGQVLKAAAFSRSGRVGQFGLLLVTGTLSLLAWYFVFYLLMLFGIIGTFDLLGNKEERDKQTLPMTNTGILLTLASYAALLAVLLWLAVMMAASGIAGTNLPLIFISS